MPGRIRASDLPVTVQAAIVLTAATAIDLAVAAYAEPRVPALSDAAAAAGWPLVFLTAALVVVAVLDVLQRALRHALSL